MKSRVRFYPCYLALGFVIASGCGLPDFSLVLDSPVFVKDATVPNLYEVSGTVPNETNLISYGLEVYYRIYSAVDRNSAESQYMTDTAQIRNANSSGVEVSVPVPSGYRKAVRSTESSDVLGTLIAPDLSPVIPVPATLSAGTSWSVNILGIATDPTNGGIFSSASFLASDKTVELLRNLSTDSSNDAKRRFLLQNVSSGASADPDVRVVDAGGQLFVGLVVATYALSDLKPIFSRFVTPSSAALIDLN